MNTEDNFQPNVKGHASASESAGGSETAPPNDGGESDSEREAGCCAPSCSALELDGVDHDIRFYFEGDIEARYVAGIPSKIQSVRNQIKLLQYLNNGQNSSNDSKQPKNNIEPQDTIGEFIRCSQMIFDGSGDFDCGFSDQCALDLFMKLGVSLGILAETGHDLTNGFIKVSGRFVRHDVSLQNVQAEASPDEL